MVIDGMSMHFLTEEINAEIQNSRIAKIVQLTDSLFVFTLRLRKGQNQGDKRLLIDVAKNNPALYLTDNNFQSPATAPNFCMFLRKYLANGEIINITCPDFERYAVLNIVAKNSYFDSVPYKLIIELMGRYSNLILTENDIIKDCLYHVDSRHNSKRELLPLRPYVAPPQQKGKRNLLSFRNAAEIAAYLEEDWALNATSTVKKFILQKFTALSPLSAEKICLSASLPPATLLSTLSVPASSRILAASLAEFSEIIKSKAVIPTVVQKNSAANYLSILPLPQFPQTEQKSFATFSAAIIAARQEASFNSAFSQKQQYLLRTVDKLLDKFQQKLLTYAEEMRTSYDFVLDKIKGNLILAAVPQVNAFLQHKFSAATEALNVCNYYQAALPSDLNEEMLTFNLPENEQLKLRDILQEPEITVLLRGDKNAQDNAKLYYKNYTRKKNRLLFVQKLISGMQANCRYLGELKINLLNAESLADLSILQAELQAAGSNDRSSNEKENFKAENNQPGKPQTHKRLLMARKLKLTEANKKGKQNGNNPNGNKLPRKNDFISFSSSDNYRILIGRNAKQNDYLSLKLAASDDIWLHLQKAPGCHVLILTNHCPEAELPPRTLAEAAALCAWYSRSEKERRLFQQTNLESVTVDYCQAGKLKKAPGAKAGLVYYNNYKSLRVQAQSPELLKLTAAPANGED